MWLSQALDHQPQPLPVVFLREAGHPIEEQDIRLAGERSAIHAVSCLLFHRHLAFSALHYCCLHLQPSTNASAINIVDPMLSPTNQL